MMLTVEITVQDEYKVLSVARMISQPGRLADPKGMAEAMSAEITQAIMTALVSNEWDIVRS